MLFMNHSNHLQEIDGPLGIHRFLKELRALNLSLIKEEDKLVLKGNGDLTAREVESVRQNQEIISYIKKNKQQLLDFISLSDGKEFDSSIGNITSLYRLSGLQEGMLFHGLYDGEAGAYLEQFVCELPGVAPSLLRRSWEEIIKRHSILRSSFYYDSFRIPVQGVWEEVELPWEEQDYRGLSAEERTAAIRAYEEQDRRRGFDFRQAPLRRIGLLRE